LSQYIHLQHELQWFPLTLEASLIGVSWLSGGKTNLVLKSPAIELHACPKLPDDGRVGYDIFNSIV
jgi:hypothetical protein